MNNLDNLGLRIGGLLFISPKEAWRISDSVVFIDIRPDYEIYGKCLNVKEVIYLAVSEISENFTILDPGRTFIIADAVGIHTRKIAEFLLANNFTNIACLNGGIFDWERDGLPLKIDEK